MGDELEDVEAGDALVREQLRRERLVLLQRGGQHVARLDFLAACALHVQDGGLQHAAEGQRLLRLFLLAAAVLLDRVLQVLIEILAQPRQVGAARGENPLAIVVVRERVEQVLDGEVRVPARRRLAIRHRQHDFQSLAEHC